MKQLFFPLLIFKNKRQTLSLLIILILKNFQKNRATYVHTLIVFYKQHCKSFRFCLTFMILMTKFQMCYIHICNQISIDA